MKILHIIVAVLAAVAVLGASATTLQQAFAQGTHRVCVIDSNGCSEIAMGHGEDVSNAAIGNPEIVPGTAMEHGEEVSDVAKAPR